MKITHVTTATDAFGLTVHTLAFDNGLAGHVADAKHRTPPASADKTFAGVTLKWGDKFGMATMPWDWTPAVGDDVKPPPRWNL